MADDLVWGDSETEEPVLAAGGEPILASPVSGGVAVLGYDLDVLEEPPAPIAALSQYLAAGTYRVSADLYFEGVPARCALGAGPGFSATVLAGSVLTEGPALSVAGAAPGSGRAHVRAVFMLTADCLFGVWLSRQLAAEPCRLKRGSCLEIVAAE